MPFRGCVGKLGALLLTALLIAGCQGKRPQAPAVDYSVQDVLGNDKPQSEELAVDLFLDSTVSMSGFVAAPSASLPPMIRDLEAAAQTGWKKVAVRYFKFGTSIIEQQRDQFVRGVAAPSFFTQKGVAEKTNIDAVLAQSDPNRLTLLITDLFQDAGDVNAVVNALKQNVLARGVPVGLLPVLSHFDGMVFDANTPPYRYRSTEDPETRRAFFLLMFGNRHDIRRLVDVMGAKEYVDRSKLLLLAPSVTKSFQSKLDKASTSKNLISRPAPDLAEHEHFFDLRDGPEGSATFEVVIEPVESTPPLRMDRFELVGTQFTDATAISTADVSLREPIVPSANSARVPLRFAINGPPGYYYYSVDLRTPTLDAFAIPDWVGTLNSNGPTASFEPNKTFNLAPFVQGLVQASASLKQISVARIFLRIQKR